MTPNDQGVRHRALGLIAKLDTTSILDMLAISGHDVESITQTTPLDDLAANPGIESWNDRRVTVAKANKPEIFDRNQTIEMQQAPRQKEFPYMQRGYESQLGDMAAMENGEGGM